MIPSLQIPYLTPENQYPYFPTNFTFPQNNYFTPSEFTRALNEYPSYNTHVTLHEFPSNSTSLSNNTSTSDEADNQQHGLINERKQRRMISNRESARRSRMRKQRHLDELCSLVLRLRNENYDLLDKLNRMSESHDKVLEENMRLKEETCELRQWLSDIQLGSPHNALKDME